MSHAYVSFRCYFQVGGERGSHTSTTYQVSELRCLNAIACMSWSRGRIHFTIIGESAMSGRLETSGVSASCLGSDARWLAPGTRLPCASQDHVD